jgi:hypothetical protein
MFGYIFIEVSSLSEGLYSLLFDTAKDHGNPH